MTKQQKNIKINIIMNAILTMSSFIFPLITFPYVSRVLLPVGTGKVSFATSFISYFTMIAQLGIPTYGIRTCAKVRDDREKLTRTSHELLAINLIMSVVAYIILAIVLLFIPRLYNDRALYIIVSSTIILTAIGMEWLYKALEQYVYITMRSIIFKFVALVSMFLFIHDQRDYVIYGGITILASSASNIFNFINVHKYIDMKPQKHYNLKRHLKPVSVFFLMACATTIYTHLDTVMLGFMATDIDVGYYNAAVKIKTILVSIVTSVGAVLLPRVSYYIENSMTDKFEEITQKALTFVFLFALPLMIYFILYAEEGIYFLSGENYSGAIVPMQIIMPTLLFIGITNILGIQMLVPLGKEKIVLCSEIAGAIVDVVLNIILIPSMAATGAAIGTLIAEFTVLVIQYTVLRHIIKGVLRNVHYVKILIALVLSAVSSFLVKSLGLDNFVMLLVSACLFFGIYGLFLLFTKEPLVIEITSQVIRGIKKKKDD